MKKLNTILSLLILFLGLSGFLYSSKTVELKGLKLLDYPSDRGDSGIIVWDINEKDKKYIYEVYVSSDEKNWILFDKVKYGEKTAKDIKLPFWLWDKNQNIHALKINVLKTFGMTEDEYFEEYTTKPFKLYAKVQMKDKSKIYESQTVSGYIKGNWFRADRINHLLMLLIISIAFFIIVMHAKRKELFIRRIAGLDAIDEAVGRATEMGKPVIYVPGIGSMSNISTIASVFILGEVSKKIAQYDATIKVPHYDPIVFTVAKETVKEAYIEAERLDSYRDDINMFITQDQFAYAAAVDGMIAREKPAACFYMGYFMAESLLLAEVGASTGAIQIAGTDIDHQLPFFVTACDYTLIGEELYAAGAYLSREPMLVSALKVQDFGKLIFIIFAFTLSTLLFFVSMSHSPKAKIMSKTIIDILRVN